MLPRHLVEYRNGYDAAVTLPAAFSFDILVTC